MEENIDNIIMLLISIIIIPNLIFIPLFKHDLKIPI